MAALETAPDLDGMSSLGKQPFDVDMDSVDGEGVQEAKPHTVADQELSTSSDQPNSSVVSKYLKGKEREWEAVSQRTGPLTLLELPVDILRLIVKEITHTNDLTALALTNSTLHNLAIPHIYARFDIVWPDAGATSSDSKSVDALTYGLSTLCLGSSFARTARRRFYPGAPPLSNKFSGNEYAKYTRKFSLGNGPSEWVSEYSINKESGKMLGTLVAMAAAKMVNLETFVWDMPTGVQSDIFMALASLPEHHKTGECKLERVWIRWHDNSESLTTSSSSTASPMGHPPAVVPLGSTLTPIGILLPLNASHPTPRSAISYSDSMVEYPTFSVLPPLKSLTVLEIDELAYLDEMADLIALSKDRLQELRVGVSSKAAHKDFVQTWDGAGLSQIDHNARWPGESVIGERRLGGVLGVLVGKIYDIRRKGKGKEKAYSSSTLSLESGSWMTTPAQAQLDADGNPVINGTTAASSSGANGDDTPTKPSSKGKEKKDKSPERKRLEGKLKLQTLELERIPLSMQVCGKAIDWTVLTNLTILECAQHENLWKLLRKHFQPTPMTSGYGIAASSSSRPASNAPLQYHLALKKIHTDVTSTPLINFIRETLAPNSLETLFLQDRRRAPSGALLVTIDQIFRGAIKRHRTSLRRLLLDSSIKNTQGTGAAPAGTGPENTRWRNWVLTTEILLYVTSGRMGNLRELAVSIDYKDWHTFLQRLPYIPQLRSLNLPYIADHVVGNFEPKELALQIADIITLRPEIQLCYVGLSTKCFELLESRAGDPSFSGLHGHGSGSSTASSEIVITIGPGGASTAASSATGSNAGDNDSSDNSDDEDQTEDEGAGGGGANGTGENGTPSPTDPDDTQSEDGDNGGGGAGDSDDDSDDDEFSDDVARGINGVRLRLREILFYDDKVAIFKARHARL